MSDFKNLGPPVILIGMLWAAADVVLNTFVVINARRDFILTLIEECGTCTEKLITPHMVYWTNLLPLSIGLSLFLAITSWIIWNIPNFFSATEATHTKELRFISRCIATLPIFGTISFFSGAIFDFFIIFKN